MDNLIKRLRIEVLGLKVQLVENDILPQPNLSKNML
jgi:hypothetical protein